MGTAGSKLPDEICEECKKKITRRARANLFGERIVCTDCHARLTAAVRRLAVAQAAETARLEAERNYVPPPATERQIRYARELGLSFPPGITCQAMSDLIENRVNPPAPPRLLDEARRLGHQPLEGERTMPVEGAIAVRQMVERWVYSVLRTERGQNWIVYSDCPAPRAAVLLLMEDVLRDESLLEDVHEAEEGDRPVQFYREMDRRGIDDRVASDWYFFAGGGTTTSSKAYTKTRELIERRIQWV